MKGILSLIVLLAFAFTTTVSYASNETKSTHDVEYINSVHSDIVVCENLTLSIENPVCSGVLNYETNVSIDTKESLFIGNYAKDVEMITTKPIDRCLFIYYTSDNVNLFQINKNLEISENYNLEIISYDIDLMNGNNYKVNL